eukprot:6778-Heterococcus_DN1.PRE.2
MHCTAAFASAHLASEGFVARAERRQRPLLPAFASSCIGHTVLAHTLSKDLARAEEIAALLNDVKRSVAHQPIHKSRLQASQYQLKSLHVQQSQALRGLASGATAAPPSTTSAAHTRLSFTCNVFWSAHELRSAKHAQTTAIRLDSTIC